MITLPNAALLLAILATALMAGLFYSYSCSVNPGLAKLPDAEYLRAMQSINRAILNPAFFGAFFGALVLLPLSAWLNYSNPVPARFWLLLAASVLYGFGLFGVTVLANVPLNEMLDRFDTGSASAAEIAAKRAAFEVPWNSWHRVRTIAVVASLVCVAAASMFPAGQEQ